MNEVWVDLNDLTGPPEKKKKIREVYIALSDEHKNVQAALHEKEMALQNVMHEKDMALQKALSEKEFALKQDVSEKDMALQKALSEKEMALQNVVHEKEMAVQKAENEKLEKRLAYARVSELEKELTASFRFGGKLAIRVILECELKHLYHRALDTYDHYKNCVRARTKEELENIPEPLRRYESWGYQLSTGGYHGSILEQVLSMLADDLTQEEVQTEIPMPNQPGLVLFRSSVPRIREVIPTLYAVLSRAAHQGVPLELTCQDGHVTIPVADLEFTVYHQLALASLLKPLNYIVAYEPRTAPLATTSA